MPQQAAAQLVLRRPHRNEPPPDAETEALHDNMPQLLKSLSFPHHEKTRTSRVLPDWHKTRRVAQSVSHRFAFGEGVEKVEMNRNPNYFSGVVQRVTVSLMSLIKQFDLLAK